MARKYDLANKLPIGIAVQGEIMGPKIAGNKLELDEHDLFIFSIYDLNESRFFDLYEFLSFCSDYGLKTVPVEGIVVEPAEALDDMISAVRHDFSIPVSMCEKDDLNIDFFLRLSQGTYKGTNNRREGIVVRPVCNVDSPTLAGLVNLTTDSPRLTFKVLNNDYLLKDES